MEDLIEAIARNALDRVEWIQIREKDLSGRELYQLTRRALEIARPHKTKVIVNTRVDVAIAAGADGVHLPSHAPSPERWKGMLPRKFLVGVSCHSVAEMEAAEREGASYVFYGPVFAPRSKATDSEPVGLHGLAKAVRRCGIPVLALGGVSEDNVADCVAAGAAGVAAITMFQNPA
jgi:thiamine-phosphate pyrophosphorylase